MTSLNTPAPVQKLRVQYKIREPFDVFLAQDLVPVTIVDDLSGASIADVGYPRRARGFVTAAAVAAQIAQCQCVGVLGVGKIFHITGVTVDSPTAQNLLLRVNDPAVALAGATNVTTKDFMDRGASGQIPDLAVSQITSATIFGRIVGEFRLVASISSHIDLDIVLRGADFVAVTANNTNTALSASWEWTEYRLEDR